MLNKILIIVSSIILSLQIVLSQDAIRTSDQEIIESILDVASDGQDMQINGEELEYFIEHPVNIAKPNYYELTKIPFVSSLLAESIMLFTDTVQVVSVDQLRSVALMTDKIFIQLLPFITIETPSNEYFNTNVLQLQVTSRSRLERRLQSTKGFNEDKFLGDRNGIYQRIKISTDNIETAGLMEKDVGEEYKQGLGAGYLSVKNLSFLNTILIGNYNISSGQGLLFAKNIASSKGNDAIGQIRKRGSFISPSVSTDEFRYFQGIASRITLQDVTVSGFYSSRKLPATIDSNGVVTSLYTSGIYRTENDLRRRNTLGEKVVGGKLEYMFDATKTVSLNIMNVDYSNDLTQTLFDLEGRKSLSAGSLSWEIPFSGIVTFGEAATNDAERFSKVFGAVVSISESFAVSYHFRTFVKGYTSPFAHPFAERDNIGDGEIGNYVGMEIKRKNIVINSFVDQFYLPSTTNGFGLAGRDMLLAVHNSVSRQLDFNFHVRNKTKSQTGIHFTDDERIQTNYRASYKFKISPRFSISQRFEFVKISYFPSRYNEDGFLTFVEGTFKNMSKSMTIKSRIIFFDTRSYDSRLYQYESDVAGNFSNPPIYGKGVRWYLIGGYELFDDFIVSVKYSKTKKLNEIVIGSGDDEIKGNLDNQIALQVDFAF
jgi:hypothetical protein